MHRRLRAYGHVVSNWHAVPSARGILHASTLRDIRKCYAEQDDDDCERRGSPAALAGSDASFKIFVDDETDSAATLDLRPPIASRHADRVRLTGENPKGGLSAA